MCLGSKDTGMGVHGGLCACPIHILRAYKLVLYFGCQKPQTSRGKVVTVACVRGRQSRLRKVEHKAEKLQRGISIFTRTRQLCLQQEGDAIYILRWFGKTQSMVSEVKRPKEILKFKTKKKKKSKKMENWPKMPNTRNSTSRKWIEKKITNK